MALNNEGLRFSVTEITDTVAKISDTIRDGEEGIRDTKKFLDTTLESIYSIADMAKRNLESLVREILDIQEKLSDIISEMEDMASVPGMGSAPMFQNPNAPYRGGHNYNIAASQLAQHDAMFGTPNAAYEKLREEQRFQERELSAREEKKRRLELVLTDCDSHIRTLREIAETDLDKLLQPLYDARDTASEAESLGAAAAREMGRLIGRENSSHRLHIVADTPSAFGKAASSLKEQARKMQKNGDELQRKMRLHRHAIQKSPIMDTSEQVVHAELRATERLAEGLLQRADALSRIEKHLREYQSLA